MELEQVKKQINENDYAISELEKITYNANAETALKALRNTQPLLNDIKELLEEQNE